MRALATAVLLLAAAATPDGPLASPALPPSASASASPSSSALPQATSTYVPGPSYMGGTVVRTTPHGVLLQSAGSAVEVDLSVVVDVWKETSVPASEIEVGDELQVSGTSGPTVFIARYVWVNIGRADGVVIALDDQQLVLGAIRRSSLFEQQITLSTYLEIVRLAGTAQTPATTSDLLPGVEVGMVTYRPKSGVPRATRIWIEDTATSGPTPVTVLGRSPLGFGRDVAPVPLTASASAGLVLIRGRENWWYEGVNGRLVHYPAPATDTEHQSPAGGRIAVEHLMPTSANGAYLIARELAMREQGVERVIYRASGDGFYWSGWSPDGRYVAFWEIDRFSGSVDLDGRSLVVIDVATGARTSLGKTLLYGTTAWAAPHTLAYVSGGSRMASDTKTLRLYSPDSGIRDLTGPDLAVIAPAWSTDGRSLFFVSGPAGTWDPLQAVAGHGVGDRRITVWDAASGAIRTLAHEPGYVEEGARPSQDGAHLLVLRRRIAAATDIRAIPDVDLELWLTAADGSGGTPVVRFPGLGLNAYGYINGPTEWAWSE